MYSLLENIQSVDSLITAHEIYCRVQTDKQTIPGLRHSTSYDT